MNRNGKGNGAEGSKWGRHPKESRKSHCVMVRFDNEEWLKFLSMHEKSGVYARAVFLKAHFFQAALPGTGHGQDAAGLLHEALRFPCAVPHGRQQLQPGGQGAALSFFGEEGDGIALPSGEVYRGAGRPDAAGHGAVT